jgi:hypothetical protein
VRKYRNIKGNLQPKRILKYSEEWIEYRKKRGADSVKVEHCDVDTDGFHDAIVRDWRSPALKKQQTCIIPVPEGGPLDLTAQIQIPQGGPIDLSAEIVPPVGGPVDLTASIVEPLTPPVGGPVDLTASIVEPSTLTLTPWQNNTGVGGPILGTPTANKAEFMGAEPVRVSAAQMFIYTQTWGFIPGTAPQFRATFQRWSTNIPGFSNSTDNFILSEGPWVSGRSYSARPIYTTVQIN